MVDTRNKRASALGFALAALVVLPAPDATVDQADRQHVAFSYAGLSAQPPIPIPGMTRARGVLVTSASLAAGAQVTPASLATGVRVGRVSQATAVMVD